MNSETKFFLGIIGGTLAVILAVAVFLGSGQTTQTKVSSVSLDLLVKNDSQVLGASTSKVTVVEFSDFECPACKDAQPVVEQILQKYGDKIRFVYREFPLPSHEFGFIAAQAAESAGLQGKFWPMHNLLFERSPDLSQDKLIEYAKSLSLNMDQFTKDYDSDAVRQRILNDQADGYKANITVTPTFFINGVKFEGVLTFTQFSQEIDSRL